MFGFGRKEKIIEALKLHRKPGHFKGIHLTRLSKIYRESDKLFTGGDGVVSREVFFLTLRSTISSNPQFFSDMEDVFVRWSEKNEDGTNNNIYVEHGWLPRNSFQLSQSGCNGRSHIKFDSSKDYLKLLGGRERLDKIKENLRASYESVASLEGFVDDGFILVALQKGNDFNLKYSGTDFSRFYGVENSDKKVAQAVIDYCERLFCGFPLVFSLHPSASVKPSELRVDSDNYLVSRAQGFSSIDFVRSKSCQGVIAINSNLLHESMVFGKPVVPLGKLMWENNPFLKINDLGRSEANKTEYRDTVDQYLAMLLCNQWYLDDFRNPLVLREVLMSPNTKTAIEVRREFGFLAI